MSDDRAAGTVDGFAPTAADEHEADREAVDGESRDAAGNVRPVPGDVGPASQELDGEPWTAAVQAADRADREAVAAAMRRLTRDN